MTVPSDVPGISDVEEETSETSRRPRSEVKEIYNKIFQTSSGVSSTQEMVNADREQYEEELKRKKRVRSDNNSSRKRSISNHEQQRSRSEHQTAEQEKRIRSASRDRED